MNINKVAGAFKLMGLFLLANITALFFLTGLVFINYAIYQWNCQWGLIASGISFVLVALIINTEERS